MQTDGVLAIDVGNSRIKFGLFGRAFLHRGLPLPHLSFAIPIHDLTDWTEVVERCAAAHVSISAAVMAGSNPDGMEKLRASWGRTSRPALQLLTHSCDLPITIKVDFPEQVGIDRLLNGVAANRLRQDRAPAIVVSAGTATTIDLLSEQGEFLGGAILPGLELGARALHQFTALLPLIDVPHLLENPDIPPLGTNTVAAIRSGVWHGHVGAIREVVFRLADAAHSSPPLLLVTGGNGRPLATALGGNFQFEADLALRGLAVASLGSPEASHPFTLLGEDQ